MITIVLIVCTIIAQGMQSCNVQTPNWVEGTTTYMSEDYSKYIFF